MADQKRTALDWEDLRIFAALARHGSLSAAARAMAVTHATVGRRVASLERSLGERLVERRPDGYVLTVEGERVLKSASEMQVAAETLTRGSATDGPRGLVRVNSPPSLAHGYLADRLARLTVQHPGLDIDLATDVRVVSLERHETDIALRFGRPEDGDVIARPLATLEFGFYATKKAWEQHRAKGTLALLGFDEANAHLPETVWLARHFPRARFALRTSSQAIQALAARADGGIAMLPHYIGRADKRLHKGTLLPLPPSRQLWLLIRRASRQNVAVQRVVDFLLRSFEEEQALFGAGAVEHGGPK